ncbi:MAG: SUMF1/EgtB/PvdO family nonheme iron enzyme [Kouleothrix sp.]|nr:SUMF1/EgtB/PvdO family nonheme iron enzyme [Kouleothrix sp.]
MASYKPDPPPLLQQYQRAAGAGSAGIAASAPEAGQALISYLRAIVAQARDIPLGRVGAPARRLPLLDLYLERGLLPLEPAAESAERPQPGQPLLRSPLDLIRPAGARIVLEGRAGSGKSTCLRRLALACAASWLGEPDLYGDLLAAWPGPPPLPLLLSARDGCGADPLSPPGLDPAARPAIREQLQLGRALVLIDGLDDLADRQELDAALAAIERLSAQYPANRYVVASGPRADRRLAGFARYSLAPLDAAEVDAMIARWYGAIAGEGAPDVGERVAVLQGHMRASRQLHALAASPLGLALCILAHADGHALPAERGAILARLADLLLDGWDTGSAGLLAQVVGAGRPTSVEQRLGLLEPLALALQSEAGQAAEQPGALSDATAAMLLRAPLVALGVPAEQASARLLDWCCDRGILTQAGAQGDRTIAWPPLREYLAARALAAAPDFVERAAGLGGDPRWHEPIALAISELGRERAPQAAGELFRRLIERADKPARRPASRAPASAPEAAEPPWGATLLAAACLLQLGSSEARVEALRVEARARLVELMQSRACPLAARVRAGLLLGELGDPRFASLLPPLAHIPAGAFVLGAQGRYEDEGPTQRVNVPSFSIGLYPVTNHEYARFLADELGYPPPRYWHDPRFNNPAQPVVGVTWHDASAYCRWLSERLALAGLLPAEMTARLPLEVEWEKAAGWDARRRAKRRYPWGEEWSSARANTAEARGAWVTAPVGCYPEGVSPFGAHDMIGNVWEWMASVYASYPGSAAPFHEPKSYVLRGSSCVSLPKEARCTYRSRLPADYWRYHLGFRVVVASPLDGGSGQRID